MGITLRDIAVEAGVSTGTVSRILAGKKAQLYAPATRTRIEQVARRLGYRPNHTARALVTGRTNLVTLWSYHPYEAFFALVMEEVQRLARKDGYAVLVADAAVEDTGDAEPKGCYWPSDGILAMDCGALADRVLHARPSSHTPIVSMGTALVPDTDGVQLDMAAAFRQAAEQLVAAGCKRIAYVSIVPKQDGGAHSYSWTYASPREAYRTAMQAAGLPEEYIRISTASRPAARENVVDYVREHGCPDGLLCRDDTIAIGAYRAMYDLGIQVGRDVLMVGANGILDTQYLEHPLSTIVLPVHDMCRLAWSYLMRRMDNPSTPRQHAVLAATLETRESSQRQPV
jgi:LacI family transcriptional regulator